MSLGFLLLIAMAGPKSPTLCLDNALALMGEAESSGQKIGLLSASEIQALKLKLAQDSEMQVFFAGLEALMGEKGAQTPLAAALRTPQSPESNLFIEYLRYLSHRLPKRIALSQEEQKRIRALEPALQQVRAEATLDLIMFRIATEGERIPPDLVQPLSELFQGGADRVETRAATWMINGEVGSLIELERKLASDQPVPMEEVYEGIRTLAKNDGGAPTLIQQRIQPGESLERKHPGLKPRAAETQAIMALSKGGSIVGVSEAEGLANVARQRRGFADRLVRMEALLEATPRDDPSYAPKVEAYRTLVNRALYKANDLGRSGGAMEVLGEVTLTVGDAQDNLRYQEYLNHWVYAILANTNNGAEFRSNPSKGDLLSKLYAATRVRRNWTKRDLEFVMDRMEWISKLDPKEPIDPAAAQKLRAEILTFRREEPVELGKLKAALRAGKTGGKRITFGTFSLAFETRTRRYRGEKTKILYVLKNSGAKDEFYYQLDLLEKAAKEAGYDAIQFERMGLGDEVLISELDYHRITTPRLLREGEGRPDVEGVFKSFRPKPSPPPPPKQGFLSRWLGREPKGPDRTQLRRFLKEGHRTGILTLGNYEMSLRTHGVPKVPSDKRYLTLMNVNALELGAGQYEEALRVLGEEAQAAGFDGIQIEGVDDVGHWIFYENTMKYRTVPANQYDQRHFYYNFNDPFFIEF